MRTQAFNLGPEFGGMPYFLSYSFILFVRLSFWSVPWRCRPSP